MKNIKLILQFIVTIGFCAWMWLPTGNTTKPISNYPNIQITISSSKDTFSVGESVQLHVTFKNISGNIDSIALLNEDEVAQRIAVKDEAQNISEYKGSIPSYLKIRYKVLQPSEEISYTIDLQRHYGFERFVNFIAGSYSYFNPGIYTAQAYFDNDVSDTTTALNMQSNQLSFVVIDNKKNHPTQTALTDLYSDAIVGGHEKARTTVASLLRLMITYPNTDYYHKAFNDYTIYLRKYDIQIKDKSNELETLLNNDSSSDYAKTTLLLYAHAISQNSSKSQAVSYLKGIKETQVDTQLSMYADYLLQLKYFKSN